MKRRHVIYKEIGAYLAVFVIGVLLLQLMSSAQLESMKAAQRIQADKLMTLHLVKASGGILMGVLIKWRDVLKIIQGELKFNLKLIPGILLGLISLIPPYQYLLFFGMPFPIFNNLANLFSQGLKVSLSNLFIAPLIHGGGIFLVLSVAAGVLIVEGVRKTNNG